MSLPPSLSQLESELARLRPSAPSPACEAKLEARLSNRPARIAWQEWRPLAQAAAIVLTAICLTFWIEGGRTAAATSTAANAPSPTPTEPAPVLTAPALLNPVAPTRLLRPSGATQIVLSAEPEGMVQLSDGSYARRIRTRSIQQLEFSEESGASLLSYSVPREDVILVPMDTY
jgi:hypothetical protein